MAKRGTKGKCCSCFLVATFSPPVFSSALWLSTGLVWASLEDGSPSAVALPPPGDLTAFVGVLAGDLWEAVLVSLLHGLWLSWRPLVNFSCCRKHSNTSGDRRIHDNKPAQDDACWHVRVREGSRVGAFTFSASSGTVSSPFTTVNRLVCETGRLRKLRAHLTSTYWSHYGGIPCSTGNNSQPSHSHRLTFLVGVNKACVIRDARSERISYPNLSLSSSLRVMYICSWIRTSFTNVCKTSNLSPGVVWNSILSIKYSVSRKLSTRSGVKMWLFFPIAVSYSATPLFSL